MIIHYILLHYVFYISYDIFLIFSCAMYTFKNKIILILLYQKFILWEDLFIWLLQKKIMSRKTLGNLDFDIKNS